MSSVTDLIKLRRRISAGSPPVIRWEKSVKPVPQTGGPPSLGRLVGHYLVHTVNAERDRMTTVVSMRAAVFELGVLNSHRSKPGRWTCDGDQAKRRMCAAQSGHSILVFQREKTFGQPLIFKSTKDCLVWAVGNGLILSNIKTSKHNRERVVAGHFCTRGTSLLKLNIQLSYIPNKVEQGQKIFPTVWEFSWTDKKLETVESV